MSGDVGRWEPLVIMAVALACAAGYAAFAAWCDARRAERQARAVQDLCRDGFDRDEATRVVPAAPAAPSDIVTGKSPAHVRRMSAGGVDLDEIDRLRVKVEHYRRWFGTECRCDVKGECPL